MAIDDLVLVIVLAVSFFLVVGGGWAAIRGIAISEPLVLLAYRRLFLIFQASVPPALLAVMAWQHVARRDIDLLVVILVPLWLFVVSHALGLIMRRELRNVTALDLRGKVVKDEKRDWGLLPYMDLSYFSLADLVDLPNLKTLLLCDAGITGSGLQYLQYVPMLRFLDLSNTKTSDSALKQLMCVPRLAVLQVCNSPVTDIGLRFVGDLAELEELSLSGTPISDFGIRHLITLEKLRAVDVDATAVTAAGVAELMSMPSVRSISLRQTSIPADDLDKLNNSKGVQIIRG